MPTDYNPTPDYGTAYDAALRRLRASSATQRGSLQNALASRGVQTSGVAEIPESQLLNSENLAEGNLTGEFALEQARTGVSDRQRREGYAEQEKQIQMGADIQAALQRRLAQGQLTSGLIGGGIGALGSYFQGGYGG